jgi:hypothetical protein
MDTGTSLLLEEEEGVVYDAFGCPNIPEGEIEMRCKHEIEIERAADELEAEAARIANMLQEELDQPTSEVLLSEATEGLANAARRVVWHGRIGHLQCGRDATRDDGLCNICRAAIARAEKRQKDRDAEWQRVSAEIDLLDEKVNRLPDAAKAMTYASRFDNNPKTDRVVVNLDWLLSVLEERS